jgi:hypothetical protein
VFGGGLLSIAGVVVGACSTDNGSSSGTPGFDAGRDTKGGGNDGEVTPPDDSGGGGDAGPDCSAAPKVSGKNHPPGPFCFSAGDGGGCNSNGPEVCCSDAKYGDGGFAPPVCAAATKGASGYNEGACAAAFANTVDGGLEFHCTEASHCPNNGERCCVAKGFIGTPNTAQNNDYPGSQAYFNSGNPAFVGGTRCRTTECAAGELTLCASDAECKAGSCKPIKIANRFTGVCIVTN